MTSKTQRAGVFYLSMNPGKDRYPVNLRNGRRVYVRVDEFVGMYDLEIALSRARPALDEDVMNSHHL